MEFIKLAQNRYSCRKFSDKAVEPEKLSLVLEAGRLSPTVVNGQPVTVKVLKSEAAIAKLRGITRMAYNAPVVLMVCYDKDKCYSPVTHHDDFVSGDMDSSIVTTSMMCRRPTWALRPCGPAASTPLKSKRPSTSRQTRNLPVSWMWATPTPPKAAPRHATPCANP